MIIFELTNGGSGFSRSTVSFRKTEAGARAAAQKVFESYEPFRKDEDTEDIFDEITWAVTAEKFNKHITFAPTLKGHYSHNSFFEVHERELQD